MSGKQVAVIPASRSYYHNAQAAVKALLCNSDVDEIVLTIEDDTYPEYLPYMVRTINVSELAWKWLLRGGPNIRTSHVYLCLLRLAYAKLLPDVDRVLALDADALVVRDVGSGPWKLHMGGAYFAGVPEIGISAELGRPYISAGVMLMDLKRIRKDGMDDRLLDRINTHGYRWVEQDCINDLCGMEDPNRRYPGICVLGNEWNSSQFTGMADPEKMLIRHFAYEQDWRRKSVVQMYECLPWENAVERWTEKRIKRGVTGSGQGVYK